MRLQTRLESTIKVIDMSGRLDSYSAPQVSAELEKAWMEVPARLLVNLSEVPFIDSTGLASLVQAMKRCRERNGDLRICGLQRPTRMIFELTRLDKAFEIFATEAEGVQSFLA
jgi:anti-sigma B factor antagonist